MVFAGVEGEKKKIFLIVDEAAEVVNEPYISILNKGAGAGFLPSGSVLSR